MTVSFFESSGICIQSICLYPFIRAFSGVHTLFFLSFTRSLSFFPCFSLSSSHSPPSFGLFHDDNCLTRNILEFPVSFCLLYWPAIVLFPL